MPSTATTVAPKPVHKNSKKIFIRRKASFAESAQTGAAEFMSMSKKSIGSYFEKGGSQGIGSGLTFEEKNILMPYLVSLPADDRDFQKTIKLFFEGIATKVPYGEEGVQLEIGLTLLNSEPVTHFEKDGDKRIYNIPINILDYVRWRHAAEHPQVALSLKAAIGNPLIQYYLYDPIDVIASDIEDSRDADEALNIYLKVKDNPEKVWAMLLLLDVDPRTFSGPKAADQRTIELRGKATDPKHVAHFIHIYKDDMFEQKYLLEGMVRSNIIKRIGSQFIFAETNKIIGNTEEEALFFFTDPKNSESVVLMKAQLQEANKQVVKKTTNKTRTPVGR